MDKSTGNHKPNGSGFNGARVEAAFPFTLFDNIDPDVRKLWIVKGVIVRGETSCWYGAPGSGKSAILTDLAVHVGAGLDWRGYRLKEQCGVLILAFERADLTLRRLEAYKRKYNLHGLPIAIVKVTVDLTTEDGGVALIHTISAVEAQTGFTIGLVIVDTYSKAIAHGGGDENSAKDVNNFVAKLRVIQAGMNFHLGLIGHSGKDEERGHRGSNALLGDVDVQVRISGEGSVRTAMVEKANDQAEGELTNFSLEAFNFGPDEDGDPRATSILTMEVPEAQRAPSKLNHGEKIAREQLCDQISSAPRAAPYHEKIPRNVTYVASEKAWRRDCYSAGIAPGSETQDAKRKAFSRAVEGLKAKGLIGLWDDHVWLVHENRP